MRILMCTRWAGKTCPCWAAESVAGVVVVEDAAAGVVAAVVWGSAAGQHY